MFGLADHPHRRSIRANVLAEVHGFDLPLLHLHFDRIGIRNGLLINLTDREQPIALTLVTDHFCPRQIGRPIRRSGILVGEKKCRTVWRLVGCDHEEHRLLILVTKALRRRRELIKRKFAGKYDGCFREIDGVACNLAASGKIK